MGMSANSLIYSHLVPNQPQFQAPPAYGAYQFSNHQQLPSTNQNISRMQNMQPPLQSSSLISPPLEKVSYSSKPYILETITRNFVNAPFFTEERTLPTPAPMPLDCVLGTDTPSPSNHSSSPPMDTSELLVLALKDDQASTTRKRKASNEITEKPAQKRHRRTKAEIIAAKTELLKKSLKPCAVVTEKIDLTRAETPVRLFQGQLISKNLPRVPRMKFVPNKFTRIDELGFMLTMKGVIYSCMTACSFKTYDSATFSNHLIKHHGMGSPKASPGGKKCHSCGLHTPDGSLINELKHIRDHLLGKRDIQRILYSTVKNPKPEDSDEDSDGYEDEDEEAIARAPIVCKTECTLQSDNKADNQTEATDEAEKPLDEETSKALESALEGCDITSLFDEIMQSSPELDIDPEPETEPKPEKDPDFEPEQEMEPGKEFQAEHEDNVTSDEEEQSEDFYSCEGDDEDPDHLITPDVSRKSRKIRSSRKLQMQMLIDQINEKKKRKEATVVKEASRNGDKENEDPETETAKEKSQPEEACTNNTKKDDSEDDMTKRRIESPKKKKIRRLSSEDETSTKRSSSDSSRSSAAEPGTSNRICDKKLSSAEDSTAGDSTSAEDIPKRSSPILTRRKTSFGSDSPSKSSKGRILNFPARSSSRSDNEPIMPTTAASTRRKKTIPLPSSGSGSDTEAYSIPDLSGAIERKLSDYESSSSDENEALRPASAAKKAQVPESSSSDDNETLRPAAIIAKAQVPVRKSSSSDENETLRPPAKIEVKTEDAADSVNEHTNADEDANFLDKMPMDMVMKIRQTITTRQTIPEEEKTSEPVVEETSNDIAETKTSEIIPETTTQEEQPEALPESSPAIFAPLSSIAACYSVISATLSAAAEDASSSFVSEIAADLPEPTPEPASNEENNNDEVVGDKEQAKKAQTLSERYSQIERKIFKKDRRKKVFPSSLPTARKSTSRQTDEADDQFPKEGTEAYKKILEMFRIRNLSVVVVRVKPEDFERAKEPEVVGSEARDKNSSEPSSLPNSLETDLGTDDSLMIEIIQPVPDVPYNSEEHNLTLDASVVDLDCTTTVTKKTSARTSKLKSVEIVEPSSPQDVVYESLKNLYPWITEDIAGKWKKSFSAIESLMQEKCLFSTYKCMSARCSFFTTDQEAFRRHLEKHRKVDKLFLCSFCLSDEESPEKLIAHYEKRHTKDRFQCNQCMYRSTEKFYCETHQKKHHHNKPKSILKSPVIILLKTQRTKAIKKYEKELRDSPETLAKALTCKFCDCKFFDLQLYCNHLTTDSNHEVKMKITYGEVGRVKEMMVRDVCENGLYQCVYCDFGGFNKLDLIKEHLVREHPHRFALICRTGAENKRSDGKRTGNSSNEVVEIIDVDEEPSHSMKIVDLVDPKQQKDIKVKIFKGNLEDLKSDSHAAPPMLITNVEANVEM